MPQPRTSTGTRLTPTRPLLGPSSCRCPCRAACRCPGRSEVSPRFPAASVRAEPQPRGSCGVQRAPRFLGSRSVWRCCGHNAAIQTQGQDPSGARAEQPVRPKPSGPVVPQHQAASLSHVPTAMVPRVSRLSPPLLACVSLHLEPSHGHHHRPLLWFLSVVPHPAIPQAPAPSLTCSPLVRPARSWADWTPRFKQCVCGQPGLRGLNLGVGGLTLRPFETGQHPVFCPV